MTTTGPVSATSAAGSPPGKSPAGGPVALARAVVTEPFARRAHLELLFGLAGIWFGLATFVMIPLALVVVMLIPVLPRIARRLGEVHRGLAARLLDERVPSPAPQRPGRGLLGWLWAGLRDGPGWRAMAYQVLKLPAAFLEGYAAYLWLGGLANLTYPFWWGLFRNHPPGVRLSPVLVATPFPGRALHVGTFPGTFAAFTIGLMMVLAAPWVARGVTSVDRWLVRALLGPGTLTQRVRDLEQTRALAVDDAAARLRRVERDLHDGAQMHLATLAMHLGMAKEQLGDDGDPLDVVRARELLDAAHRGAKDALGELRDLARGIHPPVLDNGLQDALATLAASSAIPAELRCDLPERPAPAIETIAYFCAAELLANAAKHSYANRIRIQASGHGDRLLLGVSDDGVGGVDPARGSGLSGLAQRVRTVDGRLEVVSPPGGPTRITVALPLRT
jgi:signal transduction histidine kinase